MARHKEETSSWEISLDPFAKLTWEDLEEWAGGRIVSRGRSYQRRGAVLDLKRTGDGALVAWVLGSRRYATWVGIQGKNKLESECTCPYSMNCKHAVAAVLEYLHGMRKEIVIGQLEEDDPRIQQLDVLEKEFDIEEYEEGAQEEEENVRVHSRDSKSKTASLRQHLEEQSKAELLSLVIELADTYQEVRQFLKDRRMLAPGQTQKILQTIRREIRGLEEPAWGDYRDGAPEARTERLEAALRALVETGQAGAALPLGQELLHAGSRAIQYEHDGESWDAISACLDILFRALDTASMSPADQVEWALDMALADEYTLCDAGLEYLWEKGYKRSDWSAASDRLAQRLEAIGSPAGEDSFSYRYKRDQIANWLIDALEKAGRQDEIIPLCEREARITFSYNRLVDRLIAARRWEEAGRWCRLGIETAPSRYPGIEAQLREQLQTIYIGSGNAIAGLAIQAEEFFAEPSLSGFQALCKAARKACIGEGVEEWGRHFLETGRRPGVGRKNEIDPEMDWPLPASEVEVPAHPKAFEGPKTELLIRLAIAEKNPDEVLKWYDSASRKRGLFGLYGPNLDTEVAEAVKSAHPDRAIAIWKEAAAEQIARVEVRGYEAAVPYLREIKSAFNRTDRDQEWEEYLASLRQQNRRRPRCLELLDRLERGRRRIIDS